MSLSVCVLLFYCWFSVLKGQNYCKFIQDIQLKTQNTVFKLTLNRFFFFFFKCTVNNKAFHIQMMT